MKKSLKNNTCKAVYIHIPFCSTICSYCDFCKMYYNSNIAFKYLSILFSEIKSNYNNEIINSIYIGGGTPSVLSNAQLEKLLAITKIFNTKNLEFTVEVNIENIDIAKLNLLKKYGVNRISVGIQTVNSKHIKFLNRKHNKEMVLEKIKLIQTFFENINVDLMYALYSETIEELKDDLKFYLNLGVKHISAYSLIIEPHTKLYNMKTKYIDEDLDFLMYDTICKTLKKSGYKHYEVSNFSKNGYFSLHNLTYWNNSEYYGFGLGACGYVNGIRYENTRNLTKYLNGNYVKESHKLSINETIENEFILGLRKINGISILKFLEKYNFNPLDIDIVKELLKEKFLVIKNNYIKINKQYIYQQNNILYRFLSVDYSKYCKL